MKQQQKILVIIAALTTLIIPFFLLLHNQDNHLETDSSLCPFKMLTGLPCPGCGITKSMVYFYDGDLFKSLSYHILGPFLVLFCAVTIVVLITELITKKEYLNTILYNKYAVWVLVIFLIFYQIIRITYLVEFNNNKSYDYIIK